jgi:serine/threonine protein kinase
MGSDPEQPSQNQQSPVPALEPGQRLFNRYKLKRPLGSGGMGVVWLARDEKLEQDVALKFLSGTMLHDPRAIDRLKRETRHSLKLTHPNIIRIYDFVENDGLAAIAMEYVDGWSLWAMKVDRAHYCFTTEEIAPWVRQICVALDYAHFEAKLIHRDLKPGNLLVDARNQIKVADFGIAHRMSGSAAPETASHVAVGTIEYMSPQQATGEEPSLSDDIYSLGATF